MTFRPLCPSSRSRANKRIREVLSGGGILCLLPICLSANPTGGAVVAGSATIAGQGTNAVTINQATNTAVINWQSFSINSGQSTTFLQPGASSAALNRVLGGQTSIINGTLSANGQVYLINGNGVIVGPGGVINANAFTASTRDITNADFLSGNLHFTGSSTAGVQNLGSITALGGNVALIGRTVDNEGTISAPNGTAGLIAGDDVLLAQNNSDGSTITVSPTTMARSVIAPVGVKNAGTIAAAAAELKAANGNIYGLAVQNLGTVRATTVSHQGGRIWLTSDSGKVSNAGTLDASATAAGGKGGTVVVKSTTGAVSHTGQIVAKGGTGGTGGNAEISGAQLQFTGTVDLTAPLGTKGNLILDPSDIDIVTGGGTDITASTIDPSAIVLALNSSNVTLTGDNSITVDDEIDASGNSNSGNLTLNTISLVLNAPIVLQSATSILSGSASGASVGPNGSIQNAVDAISAGGGSIVLAPGAVYNLSQQILISKNVNLEGNGATLNGGGATRDMEVDNGTTSIDSLVFTGGNGNSSVGNAAVAGLNGDGGALMIYGQGPTISVTVTNSTFVANSNSASGGAIFCSTVSSGGATLFVINSTITGNSSVDGSVLYNQGAFGAYANATFNSDTIVSNSGTGAFYNTGLGGGTATITIDNTILVGNTNFSGESEYMSGGGDTLTDNGYNLYGSNNNAGGFSPSGPGDILLQGNVASAVASLGLFGGPTPTIPLVAGSPALAAGDSGFEGSPDQRGINRADPSAFTDGSVDIGAYEAQFIDVSGDSTSTIYGNAPVLTSSFVDGPAGSGAFLIGTPALNSPATNAGFYGEDIGQGTVASASPMYLVNFTAGDLTITQRPVVIDPDPGQGKIYGTADPVLTYTTDPADATTGLVNGDTLSGSPDYAGSGQFTGVGAYSITQGSIADSTGNYSISVAMTAPPFVISPRTVLVDVDGGQSKIYGTPDPALTYTPEAADATTGLVNGDTLSGSADYLGSNQFAPAGTYPTTPGSLNNPNYVIFPGTASSFTITPRTVLVDVDSGQTKIYGTPDPVLTYTPETADATTGLVNGDTLNGFADYLGSGQFANVGNYATTTGTLNSPNYVVMAGAPSMFAITQRSVVVDPLPGQGKTYGTPDPLLGFTTDPADATTGLVNGDTLSGSPGYTGAAQFANVGGYATNLGSIADSTGNYSITLTSSPASFLITPRPVFVDIDPGSKTYGSTDPALTYTAETADAITGLVNGDTLTGAASYLGSGQFANVGSYPTTPGTLSNPNYLAVPGAPSVFTITPAIVTVLPDAGQTKIYGMPDPALTYTETGLFNGDTLSGAAGYLGTGQYSNVGTYPTTAGTLFNSNYIVSLSMSAPSFSITPRQVIVNPDVGQSKIYGSADPVLTYSTKAADPITGLVNGDTLSGSLDYTGRGPVAPVGNYAINQGTLTNANYTVSLGAATTFAITPATLYYIADAVTVPLNATMFPVFTGSVTGFVGSDTQSSATSGTLAFNAAVSPGVPTGYYAINGSGLTAANYIFSQVAVNSVALTVGMPVTPQMMVATQAATPNTPVSQSAAQTTSTTTTQDPTQSMPGGNSTPLVSPPPASPTVDMNSTSISSNETIDTTPINAGGNGGLGGQGGQDSSSTSGIEDAPVAQASSFSPDVGATPVHGGESITVGGHAGGPPPPAVVTEQLKTVLGDQAESSLSGALADAGSAPDTTTTTTAAATTPAGTPAATPDQSGTAATVGAAAASPAAASSAGGAKLGPPGTPLPPGGVMVAAGQTISIGKGRAGVPTTPPPVFIQNQIQSGFSPETQSALSDAAGISH